MAENPLKKLESYGQSIWLDFIERNVIQSGQLHQWIVSDGVSGMTSNPSIFEKAITGTHDYDETIHKLSSEHKSTDDIYLALVVEDIQAAADEFRPIYDSTDGRDGFVSIEVAPGAAYNTQQSIDQAHLLWKMVDRPNIMVKIPGTKEGLPAIRQMLSEGVNINITLLFGLPRYREVTEAFLRGLETLAASHKKPLNHMASVASFFLSRIDVLIDPMLEKIMQEGGSRAEIARSIHGEVAIASAKIAYEMYKDIFNSARFLKLKAQGAHSQRLLWASTSTKNPSYSDVKYVDALIGSHTVNTIPLETLEAYRDHGNPAPRLDKDVKHAHEVLERLSQLGINLDAMTQQLEDEGVVKFEKAYNQLIEALPQSKTENRG